MNERRLFWACWLSLIATAFGFTIRGMVIDQWATEFNLSSTQKGEIFGAGLWPFAISIVLFSLVIDRIGYGKAMVFAFICHVASAIVTITAKGYTGLYIGNVIVALGNGTVEAVINPVTATLFPKEKTKWLNILHAAWPGGLVLGGLLTIGMTRVWGDAAIWQYKVALILIPVIGYGLLMLGCRFPVNERVAAGVSYKDMLREFGAVGALIVSGLVVMEATRVAHGMLDLEHSSSPLLQNLLISPYFRARSLATCTLGFGLYTLSLGRPMFIFLMLVMIPLATTELGTDSWMTDLMKPAMEALGHDAGWVLIYTSTIMMILRFCAGSIVHKISPLGLLAVSALVAAAGLLSLSKAEGAMILAAATLYGFGKTFFWPTTLGVVAEQFPKGGALTLNAIAGVGMLGVGVIGSVFLGNLQDHISVRDLKQQDPKICEQVIAEKNGLFGEYASVDDAKLKELPKADQEIVTGIQDGSKKQALAYVAILPCIMFVCYLMLLGYFKSKGGYQADVLAGHAAHDEDFTGGLVAPGEG